MLYVVVNNKIEILYLNFINIIKHKSNKKIEKKKSIITKQIFSHHLRLKCKYNVSKGKGAK